MPFWYHFPIPSLGDPQPARVRIKKWLLEVGAEVHKGTRIAVVEAGSSEFALSATGEGVLRERLFPTGAQIESSSPIAIIAADGENIPYGRPYSLAECVTDQRA
jgi:pyruvate/2-oxoglutarate dehydrogenase complex dihydrolipoamide acyltransferase (E2) component